MLEIYRTVIEALQSIAWMLLVFFVFALIAYVIVRIAYSSATTRAIDPDHSGCLYRAVPVRAGNG